MAVEEGPSFSVKGTSYILRAVFIFLIVVIGASAYQIWDINEHGYSEWGDQTGGWDFRGYEESFMKISLAAFGIVIPVILTLLLLPVLMRTFKWKREGYNKDSRRMVVYGMVVSFVYAGDMLLFAYGNFSDELTVPGIAGAIGVVLTAAFIVSGVMLILSSGKGS